MSSLTVSSARSVLYWTRRGGGKSDDGEAQERLKRRSEGLNRKLWNMDGEQVRDGAWSCDSHMIL